MPFFPEEELFELKPELRIEEAEEDEAGTNLLTVIVRTSKSSQDLCGMMAAMPVRNFCLRKYKCLFRYAVSTSKLGASYND